MNQLRLSVMCSWKCACDDDRDVQFCDEEFPLEERSCAYSGRETCLSRFLISSFWYFSFSHNYFLIILFCQIWVTRFCQIWEMSQTSSSNYVEHTSIRSHTPNLTVLFFVLYVLNGMGLQQFAASCMPTALTPVEYKSSVRDDWSLLAGERIWVLKNSVLFPLINDESVNHYFEACVVRFANQLE